MKFEKRNKNNTFRISQMVYLCYKTDGSVIILSRLRTGDSESTSQPHKTEIPTCSNNLSFQPVPASVVDGWMEVASGFKSIPSINDICQLLQRDE